MPHRLNIAVLAALACVTFLTLRLPLSAQQQSVAITVDDLPFASGSNRELTAADVPLARMVNRKLLLGFRKHHVPVTGFVIETSVEELGAGGSQILKRWIAQGFDLGNHSYAHPDTNRLSVPQIEDQIIRGENSFAPLMKAAGRNPEFFRFPMNHTGDSKAKHDAIATFLSLRGYELAKCSIDNSDYLFNVAYVNALQRKDEKGIRNLRREYLAYTSSEIEYYASLSKQVLGYEPPQVMLLHDNRLNADVMDGLLKLFENKDYKFVSLRKAQSDAAYQTHDTFITQYGPMWGYRWARERGVQVNGRLEPEPPQWIIDYGTPQHSAMR